MSLYVCENSNDENISKAVLLHIEHLSYRSFITKFGSSFLLSLYKDWLIQKNAILIFAKDNNHIEGFVLGIKDKNLLFSPIKAKPFKYFKYIFFGIIKNPMLLPKIIETVFYKKKSTTTIRSELLVIVTAETVRSKGLGSQLIDLLSQEFKNNSINEFVVTVHAEMERSNNFYLKNKMTYYKSFQLYGTEWNMYSKKIV